MNKRFRRKGFTVIEIVVSLAITSVIALFVFSFANSLARLWRTTETGVSTELDAQIALDQIVKDLEAAVMLERGVPMFAVTAIAKNETENTSLGEVGHGFSQRWTNGSSRPDSLHFIPSEHRYGWAGMWLRFFTASPTVNAVGYQIIRKSAFTQSSGVRYLLHRGRVRQDHSFTAGMDITSSNYTGVGASDVGPGVIQSPTGENLFLEDVIDFGVRLYVFDKTSIGYSDAPDGLRLIFPSSNNATLDNGEREHIAQTWSNADYNKRYPDVVEIYIRVLDDAASDELYRLESTGTGRTYAEIVDSGSRVYRRMVRMPGRGPE